MSRIDFVVDGERIAAENYSDPENVTICVDGGDRELFKLSQWEHLVIRIEEND